MPTSLSAFQNQTKLGFFSPHLDVRYDQNEPLAVAAVLIWDLMGDGGSGEAWRGSVKDAGHLNGRVA